MDLLVVQLKAAIRRLLDTKGVRGRVLDKVNRYGEVVIGVILERPAPPPRSSGSPDLPGSAEARGPREQGADDEGGREDVATPAPPE
ncbi:hypothetical protein BH11MYX4_BH11MYX4_20060 [soil metagenome]